MNEKKIDKWIRVFLILLLLICGLCALFLPHLIYSIVVNTALVFSIFNGIRLVFKGIRRHSMRHFLFAVLAFAFASVLMFSSVVPEWVIRVSFGMYCLVMGAAMLIQQGIYIYENVKRPFMNWVFSGAYMMIAFLLLFTPRITTELLIRLFGCYFILLSIRYFSDMRELTNPNYTWKRAFHISLPTALAALIPDWTLQRINSHFREGIDVETFPVKSDEEPQVRAMVHIGPDGFQKVGHFSFAYKNIVYSYGNYDHDSDRLGGLLGDGVYFNVPLSLYLPNIIRYEHNTIFEYGIRITKEQEEQLEALLANLHNSSYRWYTRIEREDGYGRFHEYEEDYGCRLHYRTGAKFYKIKKGRFRTYWVMGENCVMFADLMLGLIGADILSIRGIVTPGTYFDYLQQEYEKENSPVVYCTIHPYRPLDLSSQPEQHEKPDQSDH